MFASGQKDEAGWTGKRLRATTWSEFDCLPTGLKRVYWHAPYDYTAINAFDAYAGGQALAVVAAGLRANMAKDMAREAARLYGAQHPQAVEA